MRPKKIYLNDEMRNQNDICRYWEYVTEKRIKETDAEYTDLSQVWHDAKEVPDTDNVHLIVECAVSAKDTAIYEPYKVFGHNYQQFWLTLVGLWNIQRWAYLSDILPKNNLNKL